MKFVKTYYLFESFKDLTQYEVTRDRFNQVRFDVPVVDPAYFYITAKIVNFSDNDFNAISNLCRQLKIRIEYWINDKQHWRSIKSGDCNSIKLLFTNNWSREISFTIQKNPDEYFLITSNVGPYYYICDQIDEVLDFIKRIIQ